MNYFLFAICHWYYSSWFGPMYTSASGKKTKRAGTVHIKPSKGMPETKPFIIPVQQDGTVPYTVQEAQSGALLCPKCGKIIMFGEKIVLMFVPRTIFQIGRIYLDPQGKGHAVCNRCATHYPPDAYLKWEADPEDPGHGRVVEKYLGEESAQYVA